MPIVAGVVSTLSLIIGLTEASSPARLMDASRAMRVGGWILVGLSVLLAATAAFPAGASDGRFTQHSSSVCTADCPVSATTPTLLPGNPLGATGVASGSNP